MCSRGQRALTQQTRRPCAWMVGPTLCIHLQASVGTPNLMSHAGTTVAVRSSACAHRVCMLTAAAHALAVPVRLQVRRGNHPVHETRHTVVMNWNKQLVPVLQQVRRPGLLEPSALQMLALGCAPASVPAADARDSLQAVGLGAP